ncbi:MAG: hypothetical protein ACREUE_01455 [Panacagrimonas sp.]
MSCVTRLFFLTGALLVASATLHAAEAAAPGEIACTSTTTGGDLFDVRCPLPAIPDAQRYRYEVHFSGGHDDTRASIAPALDDAPLACDEARSKLRLFAEEGDVMLACEFTAGGGGPESAPVLTVRVLWHHCQHERAVLVALPAAR